jgi:hypothetical protein
VAEVCVVLFQHFLHLRDEFDRHERLGRDGDGGKGPQRPQRPRVCENEHVLPIQPARILGTQLPCLFIKVRFECKFADGSKLRGTFILPLNAAERKQLIFKKGGGALSLSQDLTMKRMRQALLARCPSGTILKGQLG